MKGWWGKEQSIAALFVWASFVKVRV
ncbi:hypothetical protein LINPERPRIM_LOCUS26779 [Linum perenne]